MRIRRRPGRLEMRFCFLKSRLQGEVSQLSDKIGQLKMLSAPTGRNSTAQGNALGRKSHGITSPVGAKYGCVAPSGLKFSYTAIPRALPWAIELRPVGAKPLRRMASIPLFES